MATTNTGSSSVIVSHASNEETQNIVDRINREYFEEYRHFPEKQTYLLFYGWRKGFKLKYADVATFWSKSPQNRGNKNGTKKKKVIKSEPPPTPKSSTDAIANATLSVKVATTPKGDISPPKIEMNFEAMDKSAIYSDLNSLDERISMCHRYRVSLDQSITSIDSNAQKTKISIYAHFNALISSLQQRQTELLMEMDEISSQKHHAVLNTQRSVVTLLDTLNHIRSQCSTIINRFDTCRDTPLSPTPSVMSDGAEESVSREIADKLEEYKPTMKTITQLSVKHMQCTPPTNIRVDFNHSFQTLKNRKNSLESMIDSYGEVSSSVTSNSNTAFYDSPLCKPNFSLQKMGLQTKLRSIKSAPIHTTNEEPNKNPLLHNSRSLENTRNTADEMADESCDTTSPRPGITPSFTALYCKTSKDDNFAGAKLDIMEQAGDKNGRKSVTFEIAPAEDTHNSAAPKNPSFGLVPIQESPLNSRHNSQAQSTTLSPSPSPTSHPTPGSTAFHALADRGSPLMLPKIQLSSSFKPEVARSRATSVESGGGLVLDSQGANDFLSAFFVLNRSRANTANTDNQSINRPTSKTIELALPDMDIAFDTLHVEDDYDAEEKMDSPMGGSAMDNESHDYFPDAPQSTTGVSSVRSGKTHLHQYSSISIESSMRKHSAEEERLEVHCEDETESVFECEDVLIDPHNTIVIDNGSMWTRAGRCTDQMPPLIFPTITGRPRRSTIAYNLNFETYVGKKALDQSDSLVVSYCMERGVIRNWEGMEEIWNEIFALSSLLDNEDSLSATPILLTEPALNPATNRTKMTQIMFEQFKIPALYVALSSTLALYASGRTSGIVLEIGDGVTQVVPNLEGYQIPYASQRWGIAGRDISERLRHSLEKRGHVFYTFEEKEQIRTMKEKHAYIALDFEAESKKFEDNPASLQQRYKLPDGKTITVGNESFRAGEALFWPSILDVDMQSRQLGLSEGVERLLYDSVIKLDSDLHRLMFNNIVISGGTTLMRGFKERLNKDLIRLMYDNRPDNSSASFNVAIDAPNDRDMSAWIGGSVLASLSSFEQLWMTASEYSEMGSSVVYRKCF